MASFNPAVISASTVPTKASVIATFSDAKKYGSERRTQIVPAEGEISIERWVELCSTTPARMFGLYPKKGAIAPGSDADIVVYDPNGHTSIGYEKTHHMNMDHSAWEGYEIDGQVYRMTFQVVPKLGVDEGIEQVREILPNCAFDEAKCEEGITALESYRKAWDDKRGCWKDKPHHDWSSHPADAFRYFAVAKTKRSVVKHVPISFTF